MTSNDILHRVTDLFATMAEEEAEITADSELMEDLGISSMDVLFLISSLEEEFKIKIPEKMIRKMVTIADVAEAIESLAG